VKRIIAIFLALYSLPVWPYLLKSDPIRGIRKIVIDPGHGGKDPGNLGTGRYSSNEKDIALDVSLLFGAYVLENIPEVEVIYTRKEDKFPELYERTALANQEKADLFISIHCDAFTDPQAKGCSSFVVGTNHGKHSRVAIKENPVISTQEDRINYKNFDVASPEYQIEVSLYQKMYENNSLLLADKIQTQFRERVNRKDRGVKREPLYVTSRVAMPSVLVELGFLTNPKEEDFLNSQQGKTFMASALYRAFKSYKEEQDGILLELVNHSENKSNIEYGMQLEKTFFSVQIFSSTSPINPSILVNEDESFFYIINNRYTYFIGKYQNLEDVRERNENLKKKGFLDCFVVGIHNEKKVHINKVVKLLK
tara:strand:- start:394 stop:1491 length:1098 start_codon:yes stop_codon:yes gene_type:complete